MEVSTTTPTTHSIASAMLENQAPPGLKSAGGSTLGIVAGIAVHSSEALARRDAVKRRFALQDTARSLLPDWRVADCLRVPVNPLVSVVHHAEYQIASYTGLHTCANPHVCPVCGAKIAERRTADINAGVAAWLDKGGGLVMATFTLQHEDTDSLAVLAGTMNEAYRTIRDWRAWRDMKAEYGLVGAITTREYTYGEHGWHPHLHALLFVRGGLSWRKLKALERTSKQLWARAIGKQGQYASLEHGVKCQLSKDGALGAYIAKSGKQWTLGDELAKANRKKARSAGGRSVAQLLADAGDGDEQAAALFQEYAHWTYRKNALVWSPGLRRLLQLDEEEPTDEQLAAEETAKGTILVTFRRRQWYVILQQHGRADVLLVAGTGDADEVAAFVLQRFGIVLEPWQLNPQQAPLESAPDGLGGPLRDESGHGGTVPRDLQSRAVLERARSRALAPPG